MAKAAYGSTDRVRRSALEQYIAPAKIRKQKTVKIHSGTFNKFLVENKVVPPNRFPLICNALKSTKFLRENNLHLEEIQGPKSGLSSTVTFVYRIEPDGDSNVESASKPRPIAPPTFEHLRGILKHTYNQLGGAEAFHKAERESWER